MREPTLLDIYHAVGRTDGRLESVEKRLNAIDQNLELVRHAFERQGIEVATISEANRGRDKKISDLFRAVHSTSDDTKKIHMSQIERRAKNKTYGKVAAGVAAILATLAAVASALLA